MKPDTSPNTITLSLWLTFGMCVLSNISAGLLSTLMSVYLPTVTRELAGVSNADEIDRIGATINALFLVGWAIGGFLWGWICDRVGRARSLSLAVGTFGIFTLLICYAPSWELVVALRLLSGFSVGGILVITPTLLSEIWPEKTRAIVLGIDSIGFPVGIFSSGAVNYLVSGWRDGFLAGFLPLTVGLLSIWLARESAHWKESRTAHAPILVRFAGEDREHLVRGAIIFSSMLIGLWGMFSWIPTWVQSLLGETQGQSQRGLAMMLLGGGGLTGGFASGWISNALGVRRAMLFCFAGCFVLSVLLFAFNHAFSDVIYPELTILSLFFGISQGLLSIYIPQLFPYPIRGTAIGFCYNIGRFVTALAVFSVGILVTALGGYGNTLLAFTGIFVIGFASVYFTKDHHITS